MFKHKPALASRLACFVLCLFSAAAAASEEIVPPVTTSGPAVVEVSPPEPVPTIELKEDPPPLATIDLTLPPDDLWDRIRHGFGMPNIDSPLVRQQQAWYLARPDYLRRVVERSRRYMHHIVEELEKRGMPTELALLPIVESAYNPMAYSRSHASGMWQFIPSTGKTYQLDQNWWMDERRDIIASTSAALEYLQSIYDMHGDWHLALASYNWGENAVARAINKNKANGLPTDYMSLTMPNETRWYVPKLQALKNILAQPQLYGVRLDAIPNQPYFVTVERPANMDVAIAARLAEMTIEEFHSLNPAYNRPVMPDKGNPTIVLPTDKVAAFKANLEAHDKPLTNWQAYTIKKGESLASIAKRHGLTTTRLKQVNGISRRMRIGPGHTLLVPAKDDVAAPNLLKVNLPVVKPTVKGSRKATGKKKSRKAAPIKKKPPLPAKQKPADKR